MESKKRISVIMPIFNSGKYLRSAIESVLDKSDNSIELLVVDDGSIDSSVIIAREYSCVRIIEQAHKGACAARNLGLANATGEYIKFFDSDDILEVNEVIRQADFLDVSDEYVIVYGDVIYFGEDDSSSRRHIVCLSDKQDQVEQLFKSNIQTSAPLHRRAALLSIGGFDERLIRAQEFNLHLRLAIAGYHFCRLAGDVTKVREHASLHRISNTARTNEAIKNSALRKIIYKRLLNDYYEGRIPSRLRRYFCAKTLETTCYRLRHDGMREACLDFNSDIWYKPHLIDWLIGLRKALVSWLRFKKRSVCNLLRGTRF